MSPSYMQQNQQSPMKMKTYQILKIASQFLLSFYVISVFFSNPTWLSLFFQSFISHISKLPSQFLSHIDDKNYVFLLCNAILVILAKSSKRMISSSQPSLKPETPNEDTLFNENSNGFQPMELVIRTNEVPPAPEVDEEREMPLSSDTVELIKDVVVKEEYAAEKGSLAEEVEEEQEQAKEEDNEILVDEEMENEDQNCCAELYGDQLEEDQAEEGSIARMNTEDLNRKFEEFIRRMKEEIRIEAQQQLVMV